MADKYYNIKRKSHLEENGIFVRLSDEGELETVAGESRPEDFGCYLSREGEIATDLGFVAIPIEPKVAGEMIKQYTSWVAMHDWAFLASP